MMIHTVDEYFACDGLSVAVGEHPFRWLRVPDETVAEDGHAVFFAETHGLVGVAPVVGVFCRMDDLAFHAVLCHKRVEVVFGDACTDAVPSPYLVGIHGGTDIEIFADRRLQRLLRREGATGKEKEGGEKDLFDGHIERCFDGSCGGQSLCDCVLDTFRKNTYTVGNAILPLPGTVRRGGYSYHVGWL